MKRPLRTIIAFTIIFAAAILYLTPQAALAGEYKPVTGTELQEMMADGNPVKIIDVRDADTFRRGHIDGAINIPYEVAPDRLMKELRRGERIVFVCYGGPTGDGFAETLAENDYKKVFSLRGGMRLWKGRVVR